MTSTNPGEVTPDAGADSGKDAGSGGAVAIADGAGGAAGETAAAGVGGAAGEPSGGAGGSPPVSCPHGSTCETPGEHCAGRWGLDDCTCLAQRLWACF